MSRARRASVTASRATGGPEPVGDRVRRWTARAAEVGALLIVSNDTDLLSMSPWRGTPVIEPATFAAKVDAMRRHARRRRR
jgi:hypothetical protein